MRAALTTLKLVLDELEVKPVIDTLADRKRVQKAVYLAQAAGVDLGYSYGWYLRGPYSPRLTRDYFALDEGLRSGYAAEQVRLKLPVLKALKKARPLFDVPAGVPLAQEDWLELLASLRYLQVERRLSADEADDIIKSEKPKLLAYVEAGREALSGTL